MRRMSRRLLIAISLALALLFVQQGAATHALAHVLAEQSQDQSLPRNQPCELCMAFAQIGGAIGSNPVHFDFGIAVGAPFTPHATANYSHTFAAFAARAPPHPA